MANITSQDVCEALMTIFARFGFPEAILLENGPQFASNLTAEVSAMLGIKHTFYSFYHAASNGLCEKVNGVIKNLLAKVTYYHPDFILSFSLSSSPLLLFLLLLFVSCRNYAGSVQLCGCGEPS